MAIKTIMTAAQMANDEKAWLALRNKYIGGSDAGSVAGFSKWKSPYQLYLEKTGKQQAEDLSGNMRVWFGKRAEQIVADRFTLDTGKKLRKTGVWVNDKYPWACATIDRIIIGENSFLECKTSSNFTKEQWDRDQIPDNYYCQILHYMTVMEMDYCYIACLFNNCSDYIVKKVEFNAEDAEVLMQAEKDFWFMVENNIEPPVDGTASCSESLLKKYPGGKKEPVQLPETVENKAAKFLELKEMERGLKIDLAQLSNEIKEMMGNNEEAYCGNYLFRWNTVKGRTGIDKDKLKQLYPTQYAECLKMGATSRSFSVKYVE